MPSLGNVLEPRPRPRPLEADCGQQSKGIQTTIEQCLRGVRDTDRRSGADAAADGGCRVQAVRQKRAECEEEDEVDLDEPSDEGAAKRLRRS